MKTHTQHLLSSLEALFNVTTKMADRHGLEEVRISTPRAKELLRDIIIARKECETPRLDLSNTAYFKHLDQVFNTL